MSRILSRTRSAWAQRSSPDISCQTCRCHSQSSKLRAATSPYRHDRDREGKDRSLPGLPEDMVDRADIENKTIRTPVGDLPLSPLMDPTFYEAKMKHKMPKASESTIYKKVKWRRQLDRNPWAHALATDIRRCPSTQTAVPRYFLQDFILVSHPETGKPWYVPSSLAPRPPPSPEDQPNTTDVSQQPTDPATTNLSQVQAQQPATVKSHRKDKPAGPTAYMLARDDLISAQNSPVNNAHKADWRKLMVLNHSAGKFNPLPKVWREDMGRLVLELMRRRIVEEMVYYAKLSEDVERNAYVVRCETWEDVKRKEYNGQRGCVLWFGEGEGEGGGQGVEGPQSRAIMDIPDVRFGMKIPVHNMRTLLGPERIAKLKEETELFKTGPLFMLVRGRTVELQLKLWKLQGYLAYPSQLDVGQGRGKKNQRAGRV